MGKAKRNKEIKSEETAALIEELELKLASMKEDKEKKCKAAKDQLVEMLQVTADKYRTATGTAEALRVLRFVLGDEKIQFDIYEANSLAWRLAEVTLSMKAKAEKLSYAEMDKLCEGFYTKELKLQATSRDDPAITLAFEMLCIDLCRNVGGAAEDMVSFVKRTQEEIDATGEKLKEVRAGEK